jgi:metal-dependent HD superfamily phosphatase/phosphodiesterase
MKIKTKVKRERSKLKKQAEKKLVDSGVEIDLPESYDILEKESVKTIEKILKPHKKAYKFWKLLLADPEARANWDMADYVAVTKLHFNDHGEIHAKVVAASALSMLQLLLESGVKPEVVSSGAGDLDDAFLVVTAGAMCHDFGNQIHRIEHAYWGPYLALPILNRLLPQIYANIEHWVELRSFILSAIHTHGGDPEPLTLEAGLVCVGDACDMTKGRGRLAFDLGNINIHTVSALSVDDVHIRKGDGKLISILVQMSNSAGIFQVQETLGDKIHQANMDKYIDLVATTLPVRSTTDKRIIFSIKMAGKSFTPLGVQAKRKKIKKKSSKK